MRNYDQEIEDLQRDIEHLDIEREDKEKQLEPVIKEQRKSKEIKIPYAVREKVDKLLQSETEYKQRHLGNS